MRGVPNPVPPAPGRQRTAKADRTEPEAVRLPGRTPLQRGGKESRAGKCDSSPYKPPSPEKVTAAAEQNLKKISSFRPPVHAEAPGSCHLERRHAAHGANRAHSFFKRKSDSSLDQIRSAVAPAENDPRRAIYRIRCFR